MREPWEVARALIQPTDVPLALNRGTPLQVSKNRRKAERLLKELELIKVPVYFSSHKIRYFHISHTQELCVRTLTSEILSADGAALQLSKEV